MMFEILMGLAILWQAWLLATIMGTDDENAHRRAMQGKGARNKNLSNPITTRD
jgi:hypothetical protein